MEQIHKTRVRIDLQGLRKTIEELKVDYELLNTRDTSEGRSRFSRWNNISKFYDRISENSLPFESLTDDKYSEFEVTGSVSGSSARVYYTPSITSLAKPFRKHIIPTKDGNVFAFFDLKAAEFFMNCVFCGELEAVNAYQRGEDIYMHYSSLFPEGSPRSIIKETLIANMYGLTPYTLSKRLCSLGFDVTESVATRLLEDIDRKLPSMTIKRIQIIGNARRRNGYYCPNGFDQKDLIRVADIDPKKGFIPNLALSCYVQSALGRWMQSLISKVEERTTGTVLSVFDSLLVEIQPESKDRYSSWIANQISPFRCGGLKFASTFFDAQG